MNRIMMTPRLRLTPYHQSTLAAGATDITIYNKMVLPLSYGDLAAEYDRLTNHVAIWDVSSQRQVQIAGPDAQRCAQYLTARDISTMVEGQGKYVAMCDHDGYLLNDPVLLKLSGGRYWFSIADNNMLLWCKAIAAERGFDVAVTEPDVSPLAVQGPKAEDLVADLFGDSIRSLKYFWFTETQLDDIPVVVCRSGWSKQGGFELFLQDGSRGDELYDRVMAAGERYSIGPGGPNHVERVESGLLSYGGDTTPDSNPFEAGMSRYVDTDTSVDYVGKAALQQIVADGPARLFAGLEIDAAVAQSDGAGRGPLPVRTPITQDGRQVGTLSAVVHSTRLGRTIGLGQIERAVVETAWADATATVEVTGASGTTRARIVALPFR